MKSISKSTRNEEAWSPEALAQRCKKSAGALVVIKCCDFERHQLWARTTNSSVIVSGGQAMGLADGVRALVWSSHSSGPMVTIGDSCDGRPIIVSITAQEIDDIPVCFVECCSTVSDAALIDEYLAAVLPSAMVCDAASFNLFVEARAELLKKTLEARERFVSQASRERSMDASYRSFLRGRAGV